MTEPVGPGRGGAIKGEKGDARGHGVVPRGVVTGGALQSEI